jgi:hypothetical protein
MKGKTRWNLWYNSNVWKEKQDGTFGTILMFERKNKIEPLV